MKTKNRITFFILLFIESLFFLNHSFKTNEKFFFIWSLIFGSFFAFRFIVGGSSLGGLGRGLEFLSSKMIESSYVKNKQDKENKNDRSLDFIFAILALINVIFSLASYYL